jgi:PAS domain S-box-containing protein
MKPGKPASTSSAAGTTGSIIPGGHSFWQDALTVTIIALAYSIAHLIAFLFPDTSQVLTPVWPAGGVGLAALLLSRRKLWPAILAVLFMAGILADLLEGRALLISLVFMSASILGFLACAWIILHWCGEEVKFFRLKEVGVLIIAASLVNAVTAFYTAGMAALLNSESFWVFWRMWWSVNVLGVLIVTPLITSWSTRLFPVFRVHWYGMIELPVTLAIWCITALLAFGTMAEANPLLPQPYLLVAFLAYIALRFGQRGTTLALGLLAVVVVISQPVQVGPLLWGGETFKDRLLSAHIFLSSLVVTGLLLAAVFTERKHAEELLRESKAQLEIAVGAANMGLWDWNLRTDKVFFSREWKSQIGYQESEISNDFSEWQSRVYPDDLDRTLVTTRAYISNPWPNFENEFRLRHKDGSYRWILARASLVYGNDGKPWRMLGCHLDITERKKTESILKVRVRLLEYSTLHTFDELLVKTLDEICEITESPIGFYHFVDLDQKTLSLQAWSTRTTEEFCTAAGKGSHYDIEKAGVWVDAIRARRPVIHNNYASLPHRKGMPEGHAAVTRELVVPVMRAGLVVSVLGVGNKAQDYTEYDVDTVSTLAGIGWEIAEYKMAQESIKAYSEKLQEMVGDRTRKLQEAQEQLVRQERLAVLGQLAGGVGHELRNPLAVMSSAIYFIKLVQENLDERVKKHIDIIENEIRNAEKIINDLLDFSRIKSVDREPVAASELVRRTLERYPAPEHVTVSLDLPPDLPQVRVDPRQMVQVVGNLVTNACQAMPEQGTLTLRVKRFDGGMVGIIVTDTGVGISPEHMSKLFEPLFTTKPRGIGLGLAVCKKLVDANGGRIEAQSEPGKGATFTVYLPIHED